MVEDVYGNLISSLAVETDSRIAMLVLDGVGDCDNAGEGTALQQATTPNLDALARRSALGLLVPVATGVTPGSGPGHLGLFGYDPLIYQVGRGVLSALGIEFPLEKRDLAARLNFCLIEDGKVIDRRAGRPNDQTNRKLVELIRRNLRPPAGVEVFVEPVAEHRALLVLRGENLDADVGETDPQAVGVPPLPPDRPPHDRSATARLVAELFGQLQAFLAASPEVKAALAADPNASAVLAEHPSASLMVLARGFAKYPDWPTMQQRFKLDPAAVAGYPMYRGVARLVGMKVVAGPTTADDVCRAAAEALGEHTFVFAHFKYTDKTGEDGDLAGKIARIEEMDSALPALLEARPDVLIVTGDHSTPPSLKAHSWHPVPVLMSAPYLRGGDGDRFDERTCQAGQIGTITSKEILPLAMAHAGKLEKYGA